MGLLSRIGRLIGVSKAPAAPATPSPQIRARYDNSLWNEENRREWFMADYLSAKSANNFQVRRQLRMRSRYEVSNNPYLFGISNSNADDLIGTGPTLQCLRKSSTENKPHRVGLAGVGRRGVPDGEAPHLQAGAHGGR